MHIMPAFIFALSANIDNLAIGLIYGSENIRIPWPYNLMISFMNCLCIFIAMYTGQWLSRFISPTIANAIGCLILVLIGCWFILSYFTRYKRNGQIRYTRLLSRFRLYREDSPTDISFQEALMLAFPLALNNLGVGLGASIAGVPILLTTLFSLLASILAIRLGQSIGASILSKWIGQYAPLVSGLLLIGIATYELFI